MLAQMLMKQKCIIKPFLGDSPSGKKFGLPIESKCRFEDKQEIRKEADGREYISNAILFLPPTKFNSEIPRASQVIIGKNNYEVKNVEPVFGLRLSHVECVLI